RLGETEHRKRSQDPGHAGRHAQAVLYRFEQDAHAADRHPQIEGQQNDRDGDENPAWQGFFWHVCVVLCVGSGTMWRGLTHPAIVVGRTRMRRTGWCWQSSVPAVCDTETRLHAVAIV